MRTSDFRYDGRWFDSWSQHRDQEKKRKKETFCFNFILPHTNSITKLINKRRKDEERMMTIVARRPKRTYSVYVN